MTNLIKYATALSKHFKSQSVCKKKHLTLACASCRFLLMAGELEDWIATQRYFERKDVGGVSMKLKRNYD